MRSKRYATSQSKYTRWHVSPFRNLACTAIATLLAIVFVPEDVQPADALRLPSAIMSAGLIATPLLLSIRSPISAVHPLHILAVGPIYWLLLDLLQGAYELPTVGPSEVRMAFGLIGLFECTASIAAYLRPWPLPKIVVDAASIALTSERLFFVATIAFILAFMRFAIPAKFNFLLMAQSLTVGRFSAPWARGSIGGWDAFLDHLSYFGYILPCITVLLSRSAGWMNVRTLFSIVYTLIILALLTTSGGRRIIGVMFGSGFVVWFLTANPPRLKHLIVVASLCALLLAYMQFTLIFRNTGLSKAMDVVERERIHGPTHLHVDDNFLRFCEIILIIPKHHPHVTWRWLLWVGARPIPRVLWPDKPVDPGFDLPTYHGMKNVTLSVSLIGELYMAFGIAGCICGGWMMGTLAMRLAKLKEQIDGPGTMVLFGTGLLAIFAGLRSGIELILMSYGILAWIALVWIIQTFAPKPWQPSR